MMEEMPKMGVHFRRESNFVIKGVAVVQLTIQGQPVTDSLSLEIEV